MKIIRKFNLYQIEIIRLKYIFRVSSNSILKVKLYNFVFLLV